MTIAFSIDPETGDIWIGEARLAAHQAKAEVEPRLAQLIEGARDHGNGYEWLYLGGVSFGGQPAGLALCFHNGRLAEAMWSLRYAEVAEEGAWPSRDASEAEIAFVREVLARDMGFDARRASMRFGWGEVWSDYDEKGAMAGNGLRYRRP